jgi:S1-C subfamily serine protease
MPRHLPPRRAILLAAALTLAGPLPCAAARWQEVGNASLSLDKVYLDLDSIKLVSGYRTALMMTVYPEARLNPNNIMLDRHIQLNAIDCDRNRGVSIQTIGYLNGKKAGTGPAKTDWQDEFKPLSTDPMTQRVFNLVCSAAPATLGPPSGSLPPVITAPLNPGTFGHATPPAAPLPPGAVSASTGSGIFVNAEGYVLTNVHVVKSCKTIFVKALGSQPQTGTIEAADPKNDLALIRTNAGYGVPAEFRSPSHPPRLGEDVGVIGYPLLGILSNEPKATFGQINSVAGMNNDYTLLQISAPVQPGNSGGPVFDEAGQVVGVVVSQAALALVSRIGSVPQNVNFAIRGELAEIFMTAHGVHYAEGAPRKHLSTEEIAAAGQTSTAQIVCIKP